MMISDKMVAAINAQIGREFGAAMQYVAIAAYFGSENLPMLAAHFYRQSEEERMHALKFVHYVVETGGRVEVAAIAAPQNKFASAAEAVALSRDWEVAVTKQINDLVDLALSEKDHLTRQFLQWYVMEQLEEVSSMEALLSTIHRAKDSLLLVEDYLTRAKAAPPSGVMAE